MLTSAAVLIAWPGYDIARYYHIWLFAVYVSTAMSLLSEDYKWAGFLLGVAYALFGLVMLIVNKVG